MKKYKVLTITQPASAGAEHIINWADPDSALYTDLQNGWSIEQMATTSAIQDYVSLTLVLASVSKDFDIEDI